MTAFTNLQNVVVRLWNDNRRLRKELIDSNADVYVQRRETT
jgi:hypothetical protein